MYIARFHASTCDVAIETSCRWQSEMHTRQTFCKSIASPESQRMAWQRERERLGFEPCTLALNPNLMFSWELRQAPPIIKITPPDEATKAPLAGSRAQDFGFHGSKLGLMFRVQGSKPAM